MATDPFYGQGPGVIGPATHGVAVTPDDTVALAVPARRIYVGGAGNLTVMLRDDQAPVTLTNCLAGTVYEVWAKRVMATGTTATNLVALW
jgi:hypothetical protein